MLDVGMKYGSNTKVGNATDANIQKERSSMKAKNKSSTNVTLKFGGCEIEAIGSMVL